MRRDAPIAIRLLRYAAGATAAAVLFGRYWLAMAEVFIMAQSARIRIVGGGASGLACALGYARLGANFRIVEKRASRTSVQRQGGSPAL